MSAEFDEVLFPVDISYGSEGGPEFSTDVIETASGAESRNINWQYPRERWEVAYGVKTEEQMAALAEFFYARNGKAIGFRFWNNDDHDAENETLEPLDGTGLTYQLTKTYSSGGRNLIRKITKPVSGTVDIFVDSAQLSSGDFTVDTTTGIVTLDTAPGSESVVTADFEFDIPVRFDADSLKMNLAAYLSRSTSVPLVEIRV